MLLTSFFQGFGTGGGLIVAIGAQNAFVLFQSIKGNHHIPIALVCIFCDIVFISLGVGGLGSVTAQNPELAKWISLGGALFLIIYGWRSLQSVFQGGKLETEATAARPLGAVIAATLAVTLLNPHFYLDTVVLLGSISCNLQQQERLFFWGGSISASTLWFLSLSIGGRRLAPFFTKELSWRILDTVVCLTMWVIAALLILPLFSSHP